MFQKILVAVDGSEMSKKAIDAAIHLAKEQKAEITLVHVERNINIPMGMETASVDFIYETIKKEGENLLIEMQKNAVAEGVHTKTEYLQGDPASQIIHLAEKDNYQLIIIGSRGLNNIKEMMLGSVSHKVSQMSHCPVLIVK
ncbi:universal stress protein [Bacillus sp. FJAT-49736]|uniref:universal stress protein n=1 Tax=Bacillus sp. FJAT-49736 TaxID=2833582 RepID=UPI001BCA5B5B|nr:universal stress protein [Bacillus sp. FJAT-49736]MBS4174809.1 universal stress protein [Bacillus sp. FJAT-49736]MBS4175534.1 universal stress protein [Bacillus sp. FJAT-49736]